MIKTSTSPPARPAPEPESPLWPCRFPPSSRIGRARFQDPPVVHRPPRSGSGRDASDRVAGSFSDSGQRPCRYPRSPETDSHRDAFAVARIEKMRFHGDFRILDPSLVTRGGSQFRAHNPNLIVKCRRCQRVGVGGGGTPGGVARLARSGVGFLPPPEARENHRAREVPDQLPYRGFRDQFRLSSPIWRPRVLVGECFTGQRRRNREDRNAAILHVHFVGPRRIR